MQGSQYQCKQAKIHAIEKNETGWDGERSFRVILNNARTKACKEVNNFIFLETMITQDGGHSSEMKQDLKKSDR